MKQNILITALVILGAIGTAFLILRKPYTPFAVDENALYTISASDCFYSIYSEKDGGLFYVSGETKVDVSKYMDKPVKIKGKFIYTHQTAEGSNRLLYKQEKLASGECAVDKNIGAVAVVIEAIQ